MSSESLRAYNERHNVSEIMSLINKSNKEEVLNLRNNHELDTSLSDFMNERIKQLVEGKK